MKPQKTGLWIIGILLFVIGLAFVLAVLRAFQETQAQAPRQSLQGASPMSEEQPMGFEAYVQGLDETNSITVFVQKGDTLTKIADEKGVTPGLIRLANRLSKDTLFPGMKLKIPKEPLSLEADLGHFSLVLKAEELIVKRYPIGIGKEDSTPLGEFKIANRVVHPAWYYGGRVLPYGHPENPLGTRWMGFDLKGYGLHGTTEPASIGKAVSLGCIRMLNPDVEELFEILPIGTPIRVIRSQVHQSQGPEAKSAGLHSFRLPGRSSGPPTLVIAEQAQESR